MSERHTKSTPDSRNSVARLRNEWFKKVLSWPALAVGIVTGLILGLFLGWYVWPVQWTNAWPGDLSPEIRAHYIAAVAEAYEYYGDDRAAEIARTRLYDLNDNLGEEIAAAQAYFNDSGLREARQYIVNLGVLAQVLNAESSDLMAAEDVGAAASGTDNVPQTDTAGTSPATSPGVVDTGALDWLNWFFVVIAAIALIGGGVYIVYERSKRRQGQESDVVFTDVDNAEVGGFDDDDWDAETDAGSGAIYRRPLTTPATMGSAPPEGDVYFDDDDLSDDAPLDQNLRRADLNAASFDDAQDDEDANLDDRNADQAADDSRGRAGSPFTRPNVLPELDYGDGDDAPPAKPARSTPTPVAAVTAAKPDAKPDAKPATKSATERTPKSKSNQTAQPPATPPAEKSDRGAETVLGVYTVQYLAGLLDYDEPHDIIDDASGSIIGECGMGVNMKNGYLQNNPEHVIALDIYLFDKKDDTRILSQNRILLCDYVRDNKLEHAFSKERPNDPEPLMVKPKATFQLIGNSMVMDCEVLEVDYVKDGDAKGIFQNLKLQLTVRDRA
ncbi:MAG: hypothetical protein WDZ49_06520 [Litorilinea sp.]